MLLSLPLFSTHSLYKTHFLTVEENHQRIRSFSLSSEIVRVRIRSFLLSPFPLFTVPRPPALAFDHQEKTSLSPMIPSIALAR